MANLLDETKNGYLFLAIPDKRHTLDSNRISTSLAHFLMDFNDSSSLPSLEHVIDFSYHWNTIYKDIFDNSCKVGFATILNSLGNADVHCHVWTDQEFLDQITQLTKSKIIDELELVGFQHTPVGYNEFSVVLRKI